MCYMSLDKNVFCVIMFYPKKHYYIIYKSLKPTHQILKFDVFNFQSAAIFAFCLDISYDGNIVYKTCFVFKNNSVWNWSKHLVLIYYSRLLWFIGLTFYALLFIECFYLMLFSFLIKKKFTWRLIEMLIDVFLALSAYTTNSLNMDILH